MTGLWMETAVAAPAAVAASWVSLLYRYQGRGRPFASWRAAGHAAAVIAVTAAAATGLGLTLPRAAAQVPPFSVALFVPALLCASRLGRPDTPVDRAMWYGIATVGVTMLLSGLEQQMYADRERWCERQIHPDWDLDQLEDAAWRVNAVLSTRVSDDRRRLNRLRSDFDAVCQAVRQADKADGLREARRARYIAEQALATMLGRGWDWGYMDVSAVLRRV